MNSKKSILQILESLGYGFPQDEESIAEFEKKFESEIASAKPKHWENPLEIIKQGEIKNVDLKKETMKFHSEGLAQAAREGSRIPDEIKKKMLEDRKNAKKR